MEQSSAQACQSRRPHSHPRPAIQQQELRLIQVGMQPPRAQAWACVGVSASIVCVHRGYARSSPQSSFPGGMRPPGRFAAKDKKPADKPKPDRQMTYPGQRIQVDVKVVPRRCHCRPELRLYQDTATDE